MLIEELYARPAWLGRMTCDMKRDELTTYPHSKLSLLYILQNY